MENGSGSGVERPREAPSAIFVRAPNWLGDVVMATPAFKALRESFPKARIVCGIKKGHRAILEGLPWIDEFHAVEKTRGLRGLLREARRLREQRFDLAVLFPNSVSSALVCRIAGIPRRIGYKQGRGLLISEGIRASAPIRKDGKKYGPRRVPEPMIDYWSRLFEATGLGKPALHPSLAVSDEEEKTAQELLALHGLPRDARPLLLNPGASFGSTKLWAAERWARLAGLLDEAGLGPQLVLVGPGEEELARAIGAATSVPLTLCIDPLFPLGALKALVRRSVAMVTTDSGPRHVAVAFDTPHVVLMGPTHPGYTARNLEHARIVRIEVDCGPCHLKSCPLDHACMTGIEPEPVRDSLLELLGH